MVPWREGWDEFRRIVAIRFWGWSVTWRVWACRVHREQTNELEGDLHKALLKLALRKQ